VSGHRRDRPDGQSVVREKIAPAGEQLFVTPQFRIIFTLVGVLWVGGWGLLMYRYPEAFARVNVRFGFKSAMNPKFINFTRWMGITAMIFAVLSLIGVFVMPILGWK
jgi:hypothetical protein